MNLRVLSNMCRLRCSGGTHPQKPELLRRPPSSRDMVPLKRRWDGGEFDGGAQHSTVPLLLPPSWESDTTFHIDAAEAEG